MLGLLFSLLAIVIVVGGIFVVCEIGDGIDRRRSKRIMAMRRHPAGKALPISGRSSGGPGEADE